MKTMLRLTMLLSIVLLASCGPKRNDTKKEAEKANDENLKKSDTKEDAEWAVSVADAGMLEVKASELAQKNATSSDVKSFAQMMIKDHTMANEELKALAGEKGIVLPTSLSNKCQNKYDDLAKKTGKDFDDAYTDLMVSDHKDAVDDFKKEAEKGNDSAIRSWAAGKVSTLEHHLDMAKQTEEKVDKQKK
jgi:putative membrane protein